ncbi:TetR/AcrR family transcriptional regulator [Pseudogemmobacter blasticus]|uniref:TetR family transcriptional regulator n=1 Tax=Fuscovulum blasticum DSM 2131 TaxID=1188250 RepID=A0A2T4J570_FUSBL|nr:TetR/AcrR family transcriptional regulator [Fuscovulum blasticum]PTE13017.1 TetR family transcriptional regulator [Fuscovulum blasticum DSM 2131]
MSDAARASIGARRNPETETAVLDAAAAIIAEEGFARLTIEAVARRARSGKATIYRWWPGRGHLLLALYTRAKSTLSTPDTGSLRGDLELYLAGMIRQWQGDEGTAGLGTLFRLLIAEAQTDETVRAAMQAERESRWLHIDRIVTQARDRGELNPAISVVAAERRIISVMWYLLLTDALPPPEATPALVADLMAGLTAG